MLSRRLVLALVLPVAAYFLVTSLSCELDAKDPKKTAEPQKMADTRQCCTPGYLFCPSGGNPGCKCCGVSVRGTLVSYEKKEGKLTIDGITKEDDSSKLEEIPFHVEKKEVDDALATMKGKPGTFILKLKLYEYPTKSPNSPTKYWHGTRFECEGASDKGNMKDRTLEFIEGWKTSSTIDKVRTKLEEMVPQYPPDRDEDKN